MAIKRVYFLVVGGTVQGVGFRYFARTLAEQHGLTGWVRNMPFNKVEGEVQGEEATVDVFLQAMGQGPVSAKVVTMNQKNCQVVLGEASFLIRSRD